MSFYVTVEVPEGVGEWDSGKLLLYPNPAHDLLHVVIPETGFNELTITDMSGRVLMMKQIGKGSLFEHISLAGFEQGMYVATLRNRTTSIRSRFIVR